jgi:hypothetical protein
MYSPIHNSFFIHVPKCAGTSIELFLFEKNNKEKVNDIHVWKSLNRDESRKFLFGRVRGIKSSECQHIQAQECVDKDLKEFKEASYTFAIVRNPWDRLVSEWFWKLGMGTNANLTLVNVAKQYHKRRTGNPHDMLMNKYTHDDQGNQLVDDVFKFEKLDKMVETLKQKLDKDFTLYHHNNSNAKNDRKHYSEYITPEVRKILKETFKQDEEIFGYEFEG